MKQKIINVNYEKGSDTATGRDKPFRTLSAAVAFAKSLLAAQKPLHVNIRLSEGKHTLSEPVTFSASDIAHAASTLTISGAGKDRTLVTSNVDVAGSAFVKVEGTPYYVYNLRPDEKKSDGTCPSFRDFYVNGKRAVLARSDHDGFIPFPLPFEKERSNPKNMTYKLYLPPSMVEDLNTDCSPLTELWIKVEWQIHCIHVVSVNKRDRKDGYIAVKILESEWPLFVNAYCQSLKGRPCWLTNNLSLLTKPNDFYYDENAGRIYYYPESEEALMNATCSYPLCEHLFVLDGISGVTVEDIGFTGTTSNYVTKEGYITGQCGRIKKNNLGFLTHAAIHCENCTDVTVKRCEFWELGADALSFSMRTEGLLVKDCSFFNLGATAVRVGRSVSAWDDKTNANMDIRIENNLIDGTGITYKSNVGIFVGVGTDVSILHNTILNSSYSAISVGWSWAVATWPFGENLNLANVEIAYNYIENYMYGMKDGGAIYTLGGNAWKEYTKFLNEIHHNYVVTTPLAGQSDVGYRPIYHDQGSSHWHNYDNVIIACEDNPPATAFVIGGNTNNLIERLYIVDYSYPMPLTIYGTDGESQGAYNVVAREVFRDVRSDALPEEAKEIIRSTGCDKMRPVVPEKKKYPSEVTIYIDPKNGNDRNTNADSPCFSFANAMATVVDVLNSCPGADITVLFKNGLHSVEKAVKMQTKDYNLENFRITLKGESVEGAQIKSDNRIFLEWEGVSHLAVRDLTIQSRNAACESTLFLLHDASDVCFDNCRFHHVNASVITCKGVTADVTVANSYFSHIGGHALSFGSNSLWSSTNKNQRIRILDCYFEHIGFVVEGSAAIMADVANSFTVLRNTFRDLSYEALRIGMAENDGEWGREENYNVDRLTVSQNYIDGFLVGGTASAAIRADGGNCNRFRINPMNVIDQNYVVISDETAKDSGDFAAFWHGSGASQFHTRKNYIMTHKRNVSKRALCYFDTEPHAHNSWADENTVITAQEECSLCNDEAITAIHCLYEQKTVYVAPNALTAEQKDAINAIGKRGHTPNIK